MKDAWYSTWFDTDYYHMLYRHRDEEEAKTFLLRMHEQFGWKDIKVLDAGCGRGRHASILADLGLETTGIDLSHRNIEEAKKLENDKLNFVQGDIRTSLPHAHFDLVLNLFTSFGYDEDDAANLEFLKAMISALKPGGMLLVDFLNAERIKQENQEPKWHTEWHNGVCFRWRKSLDDKFIRKEIVVEDNGNRLEFMESVRLYSRQDFAEMSESAGAKLVACFGDYTFADFNAQNAERLILCLQP